MFRNTQKQQAGNKPEILLNEGTVPAFRSQLEMEAVLNYTHSITIPRKPSLKPANGSSVPP